MNNSTLALLLIGAWLAASLLQPRGSAD